MIEMDEAKAIIVIYILASICGLHLMLSLILFFRPTLLHTKLRIPSEVAGDTDHDARTEFERLVENTHDVLEYEVQVSEDGVFVDCQESISTVKYVVDESTPSMMKEPPTPTCKIEDKEKVYFEEVLTKSKKVPTIIRVKESDQNLDNLKKIHYFIKKHNRMGMMIWGSSTGKTRHELSDLDGSMLVYRRSNWKLYMYYFTGFLPYMTFHGKSVLIISHCFRKKVDEDGSLSRLSKLHQWLSNMFLRCLGPMINHLRKRGIRTYLICTNQNNEKVPAGISLKIDKIPESFTRDLLDDDAMFSATMSEPTICEQCPESSTTLTFKTPFESNSPVPSMLASLKHAILCSFFTYDETNEKNPASISSVRKGSYDKSEVSRQRSSSSEERYEVHEPDDTISKSVITPASVTALKPNTSSKSDTSVKSDTTRKLDTRSKSDASPKLDTTPTSDTLENNTTLQSDMPVGSSTILDSKSTSAEKQHIEPVSAECKQKPPKKTSKTKKFKTFITLRKPEQTSSSVKHNEDFSYDQVDDSDNQSMEKKQHDEQKTLISVKTEEKLPIPVSTDQHTVPMSKTTPEDDMSHRSEPTRKSDPTPKSVITPASVTALKPNTSSKSDTSVKSDTTRKLDTRSKSDACPKLGTTPTSDTLENNTTLQSDMPVGSSTILDSKSTSAEKQHIEPVSAECKQKPPKKTSKTKKFKTFITRRKPEQTSSSVKHNEDVSYDQVDDSANQSMEKKQHDEQKTLMSVKTEEKLPIPVSTDQHTVPMSKTTPEDDMSHRSEPTRKSDPTPKSVITPASVTALKPNTSSKSDTSVKSDTTRKLDTRSKSDACPKLDTTPTSDTLENNTTLQSDMPVGSSTIHDSKSTSAEKQHIEPVFAECKQKPPKKTSKTKKVKTFITRRKPEQTSSSVKHNEDVSYDQVDGSNNQSMEKKQHDEQKTLMSVKTEEKLPIHVSTDQHTVSMSKSTPEDDMSHRSKPTRKSDPTPKSAITPASVTALKRNTSSKSDTSVKSDTTRILDTRSKSDACPKLDTTPTSDTLENTTTLQSDMHVGSSTIHDSKSTSAKKQHIEPVFAECKQIPPKKTSKTKKFKTFITRRKPEQTSSSVKHNEDVSYDQVDDSNNQSMEKRQHDEQKTLMSVKTDEKLPIPVSTDQHTVPMSKTTPEDDMSHSSKPTRKSDRTPKSVITPASATALKPNTSSKSDTSVKSDTTRKLDTCSKSETTRKSDACPKLDTTPTSDTLENNTTLQSDMPVGSSTILESKSTSAEEQRIEPLSAECKQKPPKKTSKTKKFRFR